MAKKNRTLSIKDHTDAIAYTVRHGIFMDSTIVKDKTRSPDTSQYWNIKLKSGKLLKERNDLQLAEEWG